MDTLAGAVKTEADRAESADLNWWRPTNGRIA
jgi:hypothetical protein